MKFSFIFNTTAMLAAFGLPVSASAQTVRCVESDMVGSLALAMLPGMVTKLSKTCEPALPDGAALRVSGQFAAEQYREASINAQPKAMEALQIIAGEKLPSEVTPDVAFPFFEAMLFAELKNGKLSETCLIANNVWSALKDLPFDKWGLILAAVVSADQNKDSKEGERKSSNRKSPANSLPICPYVAMES